jgi:lipid A 3-O-deacylase
VPSLSGVTGYRIPAMSNKPHFLFSLLLLAGMLPAAHAANDAWVDGLTYTHGENSRQEGIDVHRLGIEKRWRHSWFNQGAWFLGGYWDTELAVMQPDSGPDVYAVGITPVFRYQRDSHLSSGVTPVAEAGIGAHLLSNTHIGKTDVSTAFQFGSLVGFGIGFGERGQYELSYRFTHISNADIKKPNDGLDLHLVRLGYNFN